MKFTTTFSPSPLLSFTIPENDSSGGHGTTLWDGAKSLSRFLARLPPTQLKDKKVLELGCGTACLGVMVCMKLGSEMGVATDLPGEVCEMAVSTLALNSVVDRARVEPLDWTWSEVPESIKKNGPYDIVLASDTLFSMKLVEPFLDKILANVHAKSVAYIAYEERDPIVVQYFLEKAKERFEVSKVSKSGKYGGEGEAPVVIAKLRPRKDGLTLLGKEEEEEN